MPVRNIKYDKSSMLQKDLPNANFVCTDGDGLKFNPSVSGDNVVGLANHTHHIQESNGVLWNSVKLDWTRQAVGYNLLDPNQANACEDGTTNGFGPNGAASPTLSVSTTEYYEGKHSLKVVTPGTGSGEGMATVPGKDIVTGNTYSAKARVKGSGTIVIALSERDSNDVLVGDTASSPVTLTSSWQEISVSRTYSTGTKARMKVYTNSVQATTFYVDTLQINPDDPVSWVPGTGSFRGRYNILDSNQSNACENGTSAGFLVQGSASFTPTTSEHYEGSYSLGVTTNNVGSSEGIKTSHYKAVQGKYSGKARVKGSGTVTVRVQERKADGTWIRETSSSVITLTSSWQTVDVTATIGTDAALISLAVSTNVKQGITFYVDTLQLNTGDPAPWVEGPASDFQVTASLLGLTDDGEESLIGEKITTICPTTETNEIINFDLLKSACQTPFTRESGTAQSGKIQLNLPKRYSNYESIILNRVWLDGWSKRKTSIITGSTDYTYYSFVIGPLTIPYVSGMNTDFSDLRFAIWDGTKYVLCDYGIFSKTNGSTAKLFVKIPTLIQSPATVNLYMFFGNTGATSLSNLGIIYMYDDFEDGKYTGRSSPYLNYTVSKGTAAIINSGQISDTYSLKHTGGNDVYTAPMTFAEANRTCIIDFDFKLSAQGSGTYDPYVALFYLQYVDANNFLRVDTYWNGTNQVVRLVKKVSGTDTIVSSWTTASWNRKMLAGEQHHFKIVSYLPSTGTQYVTVIIDSTKVINAVNPASTLANTTKGLGCMQSAAGVWDNIKIRPYVGSFVFYNGNEASIGSWGAESLPSITPDSVNPDDTTINFTVPYDWSTNSYAYLNFKEYDSSSITTRIIPLSVQNIAQLGYNGLDAFNALRLKIESECSDDCTFRFNNFEYKYEI